MLVSRVAGTRPSKPCGALRVHKDIFAGKTVPEKLDSVRDIMAGRKRPDGGPAKATAETADALLVRAYDMATIRRSVPLQVYTSINDRVNDCVFSSYIPC